MAARRASIRTIGNRFAAEAKMRFFQLNGRYRVKGFIYRFSLLS
jgi:hypothetical protein